MFRKHMNLMSIRDYNMKPVPFYAWECLTIILNDRDIDLVIRKDNDMNNLLQILLFSMNTVDGQRDSIYFYQHQKMKRKYRNKIAMNFKKREITMETRLEILHNLMFKFKLMRIRSKISFSAFIKK
mmetsp:Transcript_21210/g.32863  ORF Transcript_21210/g.32863 Transcript_21210/m.32863 type:complete len:126 (-) Transcript_21210:2320-2697(-)